MNCLFCNREMYLETLVGNETKNWKHYRCNQEDCWYNGEFSRYVALVNEKGEFATQEYGLGPFYVKVYPGGSVISRVLGYILTDDVKIPRPLWLNVTNMDATLDKLKFCVIFS